jgi:hypothetical protein
VSASAVFAVLEHGREVVANVLVTRSVRLVALALATFVFVSAASADPIVITSGRVIDEGEPHLQHFFGADGFELVVGFAPTFLGFRDPLVTCSQMRCTAGTALDMSAIAGAPSTLRPFSLGLGTVTINGSRFFSERDPGGLVGTLRFDAPTVILPSADRRGIVDVAVPFVFRGDVTGFARADTTLTTAARGLASMMSCI